MIKLLSLLKEIRIQPQWGETAQFVRRNIHEIREKIGEEFDEYININNWEVVGGPGYGIPDPEEGDFIDYVYLGNKEKGNCDAIGFTFNVYQRLEGEGPVNGGEIIEINGRKIQYQTMHC